MSSGRTDRGRRGILRDPDRGCGSRRALPWLLGLIVALFLLFGGGSASAAIVPFNPAQPTMFIAQGTPTQLEGRPKAAGRSPSPGGSDGVGSAQRDRLRHVRQLHLRGPDERANGQLGRDDPDRGGRLDHVHRHQRRPGANVGAFGPDANCDDFYVGNSGDSTLDEVNLLTKTSPRSTSVAPSPVPTCTYANGFFWSMGAPNQIQRINVTGPAGRDDVHDVLDAGGGELAERRVRRGAGPTATATSGSRTTPRATSTRSGSPTRARPRRLHDRAQPAGPASSNNDGTNAPG